MTIATTTARPQPGLAHAGRHVARRSRIARIVRHSHLPTGVYRIAGLRPGEGEVLAVCGELDGRHPMGGAAVAAAVLAGVDRDDSAARRPPAGNRLHSVIAAYTAEQRYDPDADEERGLQISGPTRRRSASAPEESWSRASRIILDHGCQLPASLGVQASCTEWCRDQVF